MRIGIDISPLSSGHKVRGVGAYVSLIRENIEKYDTNNEYLFFDTSYPKDVDLVHYPYFDPFFPVLPFYKKNKTVVTVHDLTPIKFKKHFPSGVKGSLKWQYNKYLLKKVDSIIVDSKASKIDVVDIIGVKENSVSVVYLGVDSIFKKISLTEKDKGDIKSKYSIPERFMIYVGDVTWNKNLPRIIEAAKRADINLLLIGKALADANFDKSNPWNKDRVKVGEMIKNEQKIMVLGFVPDRDLLKIFNMAQALLMPSLYEGFGLPVLEAMTSGCPVVTSREGSLPEVGGSAVLYAEAKSVNSIANEIVKVSKDNKLRKDLSARGLVQARKFQISNMMNETIKVYESTR